LIDVRNRRNAKLYKVSIMQLVFVIMSLRKLTSSSFHGRESHQGSFVYRREGVLREPINK